ncbi:GNAT family N-acetyltransferase [Virgibacillus phasianinus]|uniref:GNAT family N-acetyltransferase n=1 Tax=Virgibacillus phasianinus TaxID=2017483 RepID=A0A220U0C5_9BACI|nr:GNAT family N-acetyltransferase [Virgibacillus phasianinus]ASK61528.1 GNAT family N-acetyltransferase [Virgibacillus phasianinus]
MDKQQLTAVKTLQDICEKEEGIQLKLNWEMLKARSENKQLDYFHYENEVLVGFLAIYGFGNEYEICGMVHPSFRGRGVFTELFDKAVAVIPANATKILINAPAKSESAKKWLDTKAPDYSFSEYQMKWESTKLDLPKERVQLRRATSVDTETRIQLDVACFGFDEAGAREFNSTNNGNERKTFYIIEVNRESIGKIGLMRDENESYIYGFAVFPKFQGKGYGKNALIQMVLAEQESDGIILLEVAAENRHALKLYEDCGFRSYEVQDYYRYNGLGK